MYFCRRQWLRRQADSKRKIEEGNENANEYTYLRSKKIPQPAGGEEYRWYNFADVYGFRPPLEVLFYLSPWEFLAHWTVVPLQPPWKEDYLFSRWITPMNVEKAQELHTRGEELLPGVHYEVNSSSTVPYRLVSECPDHETYCVYPTDPSVPELTCGSVPFVCVSYFTVGAPPRKLF